jgi:flagellar biosynthesis/type III secretory pathway protein FliH
MSALIKSGNSADFSTVRALAALRAETPIVSAIDEERDRVGRQLTALQAEIQTRDSEITLLHAEIEQAHKRGLEEGRERGRSEAEDRQASRVALLERSLGLAQESVADGIKALEQLAVLLARDCLDIILGNADYRSELVTEIVRTQAVRVERAMLVDVKVSREDFSDQESLNAIAERAGVTTSVLSTKTDMPSGDCLITLRLGSIDVGLGRQWGVLRETLDQIAAEDGTT